jgi:hypothetical protein
LWPGKTHHIPTGSDQNRDRHLYMHHYLRPFFSAIALFPRSVPSPRPPLTTPAPRPRRAHNTEAATTRHAQGKRAVAKGGHRYRQGQGFWARRRAPRPRAPSSGAAASGRSLAGGEPRGARGGGSGAGGGGAAGLRPRPPPAPLPSLPSLRVPFPFAPSFRGRGDPPNRAKVPGQRGRECQPLWAGPSRAFFSVSRGRRGRVLAARRPAGALCYLPNLRRGPLALARSAGRASSGAARERSPSPPPKRYTAAGQLAVATVMLAGRLLRPAPPLSSGAGAGGRPTERGLLLH